MQIIKNDLETKLNIRTEKDFPINGIEFIDITPLIMDMDNFNEIINKLSADINKYDIDYILAPEARGFILGSAISNKLNIPCIPIRKKGKLPPTSVEATVEYNKEYGKDYLELPKLIDREYKGLNFYLVDDILATGNTFNAIEKAIVDLGGNVIGKGVIMNIIELNNDENTYSIIDVNEEVI